MDSINNFAISQLTGGITATQLTATLTTGQGSRFPSSGAFNVVIYDASYSNAALAYQAGKAAIYRVLSRTGDILTFKDNGSSQREGQEGTTAIAHNTGGATYIVMQALTAKLITDLGSGGSSTAWVNVKDSGAIGDGTIDDTAAITAAIASIPAIGGVLYFPPGVYKTSGGFTLAYPITVLGCGMGNFGLTDAVTQINCTSRTAVLFNVTANAARFKDIALRNINPSTTAPTAGAGIKTAGSYIEQKVDYESVSVYGFYINIDVQVGGQWTANNIFIMSPVLYGIKIQNTVNADAGDWSIENSNFNTDLYNASAAIRIESSGGGKINNVKINTNPPHGDASTFQFGDGIDLTCASSTIILHVSNVSIENCSTNYINVNITAGSYRHLYFDNIGIGIAGGTSGYGICLNSYQLGKLENIVISGCNFYGGVGKAAIYMNNVNNVFVSGSFIGANTDNPPNFTGLVEQYGCTNVIIDTGEGSASGGGCGGFDANTKLLMHMNGADQGTSFKEETGRTVTPVGSIKLSAQECEFGSASAAFAGAGQYLTLPDSPDWHLGTNDFTIDFWVYFNSLSATYIGLMDQYQDTNNKWTLMMVIGDSHWLNFTCYTGGTPAPYVNWNWTPEVNHWYHVAIVRDGTTQSGWHAFVNGQPLTEYITVSPAPEYAGSIPDFTGALSIGQVDQSTSERLDGFIDELRISNIARWIAQFTPPTQPY